ncbi:MAG: hypothetical protein DMF59_18625 [Acidobacteria bacterium]|nr:MAG: hypothetical protein DMF59_18625 [Acidobacteriota bacterium]
MQQRPANPRFGRKRLESRLIRCRFAVVDVIHDLFEDGPLLARLARHRGEVVDHARIELREQRAHAIAKKSRISIRPIDAWHDASLSQKRFDLRARNLQQRANDSVRANRVNSAETGEPSAGHQAHEDGLGLIVFLMSGRDVRSATNFLQSRVANFASSGLDAVPADLIGIERAVFDVKRHAEFVAQLADELLIGIRLRAAKMMIDVRRDDRQSDLVQREKKRRRIGSARHGDHHRPADAVHLQESPRSVDDHGSRLHLSMRRQRGFTILEVLIVVAIIGMIAAIAIANYLNALQRTKQKRTMADIRSMAIAWESRAVDTKAYNAAALPFNVPPNTITYTDLTTLLAPTYMRNLPRQDAWGYNLDFAMDQPIGGSQAAMYAIRSPGRDGQFTGNAYTPGPTTEFDCDIVYSGGAFVVWPEGTQTK